MAILLIKIENENSLPLNEFFDYAGSCYASSRSREDPESDIIDMTNFYEAAVNTEVLHEIPVVFVSENKRNGGIDKTQEKPCILGWYKKAEIFKDMQTPSLFLEGNIKAYASDAVWLPANSRMQTISSFVGKRLYEVVEEEDSRFIFLENMMKNYKGPNHFLRYHEAGLHTIQEAMKDISTCRAACQQWAALVTAEECQDIRDLKTLEAYARKLCEKDRRDPDGYYYLALACYHLGFIKEGLKQINKALSLEPDASDLIAMKGLLLVSKGYAEDGAAHLHQAFEKSQDEIYLFMEGRAFMMAGKVDKAYDCFRDMEDQTILEEMGIKLKEMESKWSSLKVRYMKLKEMFWRK